MLKKFFGIRKKTRPCFETSQMNWNNRIVEATFRSTTTSFIFFFLSSDKHLIQLKCQILPVCSPILASWKKINTLQSLMKWDNQFFLQKKRNMIYNERLAIGENYVKVLSLSDVQMDINIILFKDIQKIVNWRDLLHGWIVTYLDTRQPKQQVLQSAIKHL